MQRTFIMSYSLTAITSLLHDLLAVLLTFFSIISDHCAKISDPTATLTLNFTFYFEIYF